MNKGPTQAKRLLSNDFPMGNAMPKQRVKPSGEVGVSYGKVPELAADTRRGKGTRSMTNFVHPEA